MQEWFQNLFAATLGLGDLAITVGLVVSVSVKIVIILIPLILTVAYLTYFERKVIGFMQLRVGPNVTGAWGLIQPFADVFKLLFQEVTRPKLSNKALFYNGAIMSLAPSFAEVAVVSVIEECVLFNINLDFVFHLIILSL
uniref:NADH-quinone oxidoreductase subunit H n=1 Tax=Neisseria cinerea TaxID=483 RepID=UPI002B1E12A7